MQTQDVIDIFDGYTTTYIGEAYINANGLTGLIANLMRYKYERLQVVIDSNVESGAGMSLYYAGMTYDRHTQLFRIVMAVLLFEGIILATLIMLLSLGNENTAKTELLIYSTKTGRKINKAKLISCVITGLLVYVFIATVTLILYFSINPFGGTGGSNISSGFNYVLDLLAGARPFITWHSFTIVTYLLASIGASAGVVICFSLLAYITGLWIRNGYIGFLVFALVNFAVFTLPFIALGLTLPTFFLTLSPIWIAIQQGMWFTDGGSNVILPHFETIGIGVSLIVLTLLGWWSAVRFKRRNLL